MYCILTITVLPLPNKRENVVSVYALMKSACINTIILTDKDLDFLIFITYCFVCILCYSLALKYCV